MSVENLRYMTASQALGDLAAFTVAMNEKYEYPEQTKWIVFGGAIGGSLAVWLRQKYPHLVHGAVASSPALTAQLEIPKYWDVVRETLAFYNTTCKADVTQAHRELDDLVQTTKGRKEIGTMFKLCSPLRGNQLDMSYLLENILDHVALTVQYDEWGANINSFCSDLLKNRSTESVVKRYATVINASVKRDSPPCLPTSYSKFVRSMRKNKKLATSVSTSKSWLYQICTEYGFFQTNSFSKHVTLDYDSKNCAKVFNSAFDQKFINSSIKVTNTFFGGLSIDSQRIAVVHGTADPWKSVGVDPAKKYQHLEMITIKGGSLASDLRFFPYNKERDAAQTKVKQLLDTWLMSKEDCRNGTSAPGY